MSCVTLKAQKKLFMNDKLLKKVLTAAFLIETFCVTYAFNFPVLTPVTTIIYFLSGLLIASMILFLPDATSQAGVRIQLFRFNGFKILTMGIMGLLMIHFASNCFSDNPILTKEADMLPVMKEMAQRFINGHWKEVYNTISQIWGGMKPIYLPAMWLPFALPTALQADIRWITVGALFISFSSFILILSPGKKNPLSLFLILSAFALFWWLFTQEDSGLLTYTEEGVVIAYYVLLVLALLRGNYWLIGIVISLCALSRYSFIGWIPALFVLLLLQKQYLNMGKLVLCGIGCFLLLVILPFGWSVISNTLLLPGEYIHFAARLWHDNPIIFYSSLGFSKFFGPERIALQHHLLISLSFTIPTLFVLLCWWLKVKRNKNINNISLAALKISIVLFYCFIDVPYIYLFYTSSFVSLILVTFFVMQKSDPGVVVQNDIKQKTNS
jgi:hypothetical protein